MSYNPDPEWTKDIFLPDVEELKCPGCGQVPQHSAADRMIDLREGGVYAPRHIPSYLTLTCENPDCVICDEDFEVHLTTSVKVRHIDAQVETARVRVIKPFKPSRCPCPVIGTVGERFSIDQGYWWVRFRLPFTCTDGQTWLPGDEEYMNIRFLDDEIEVIS